MRLRSVLVLAIAIGFPAMMPAQVTHGQKPHLPAPFETKSAGNGPDQATPPAEFLPKVPPGFQINVYAKDFKRPRWLTVAPNGDIFLADMGAGKIIVLRDPKNSGVPQEREVFVDGMNRPFGIAFREDYVYVGNMNEVARFRYDPKTSKRLGEKEHLLDLPSGGHSTRSLAFSADAKHLFIGVGSESNVETGEDPRRAAVTICDPDGKNARLFATGFEESRGAGARAGDRRSMDNRQRTRRPRG